MSRTELSNLEVIYLLTWKNWNVFWKRPATFILLIFSPAIFLTIMVSLRYYLSVKHYPTPDRAEMISHVDLELNFRRLIQDFKDWFEHLYDNTNGKFNHNSFVPKIVLAYTPHTNKVLKIMNMVRRKLSNIAIQGFMDPKSLRNAMMEHHYLAGVDFSESKELFDSNLPNYLNYTLIYPSEVRVFNDSRTSIGANWRTDDLYDPLYRYMERNPEYKDGGYVGYIREGFVAIQMAIAHAFISLRTEKKASELPGYAVTRYPFPLYEIDPLLERVKCCLSLAILLGFLFPTIDLVKIMVSEKILLLKDALNVFGIGETVQFIAWLIRGLLPFFIASILAVIMLKIKWSQGYGVFNRSDWTAILCFMFAYNLASVCFTYLVSCFFQRPSTAVMIQTVAWIFTYFPYVILVYQINNSVVTMVMISLFSNTAMALGIHQLLDFEKFGEGFGWNTLFITNNVEEANAPVGTIMLIMLGQALVYTLIGIIIEKNIKKSWFRNCCGMSQLCSCFGNRRKANSPAGSLQNSQSSMEMKKTPSVEKKRSSFIKLRLKTEIIEIAGSNKAVIVEIKNLCKTIDGVKVVDNVSMDLYEGEITVLLGANGSGKSLLLSMIVGNCIATSGQVIIGGLNMKKFDQLDHSSVGVSLNENMLFPDLTVFEQITFFCRMKGYTDKDLHSNVTMYLKAMNLSSKANLVTHKLTRGVKRQLSTCCALCGDSKFVVIDEPSTMMDISARKLLWDLLLKEKRNRTILISTQSSEEAEVIADRIGIMSNGKLQCFGTKYFIKSFYGGGKLLICTKAENCDVDAVTELVNKYIPGVKPYSQIGAELTYKIFQENINIIYTLLSEIEEDRKKLKLVSLTIADMPFEDIFINMSNDSEVPDRERIARIVSGSSIYADEYDSLFFIRKDKNKQSVMKQLSATFLKRWYFAKGNVLFTALQFILPLAVACFTYLVDLFEERTPLPKIYFTLAQYEKSITLAEVRESDRSLVKRLIYRYFRYTESAGSVHRHKEVESITGYMKKLKDSERLSVQHLIGASLEKRFINIWFNNYPLHTVPLSVNAVHNAILQNDSWRYGIGVVFEPLPFSTDFDPDKMISDIGFANILSFYFAFAICSIYAMEMLTIINERVSTFKLLQYINGLKPFAYLFGNLTYDLAKCCTIGLLIVGMLAIVHVNRLYILEYLVYNFILLVFFAFGISTWFYCLAVCFNIPLSGCIAVIIFNVYCALLYVSLMEVREERFVQDLNRDSYSWPFLIFPIFSFCRGLNKIGGAFKIRQVCSKEDIKLISVIIRKCKVNPNCCVNPNELEWGNTFCIIPEMSCLILFGITFLVIFCLMEYDPDVRVSRFGIRNKKKESSIVTSFTLSPHNPDEFKGKDMVEHEKRVVHRLKPAQYVTTSLVMDNVSKSYGKGIAVNQIYLRVKPGECFGILGVNGSGKSTIIKLLVGYEGMTVGEIYVDGIRMNTNLYEMYKHVGYCPKPDSLPKTFEVHDIMKLMCILRGIPSWSITVTCENLAKTLDFYEHLYTVYGTLSSGNKLRVCAGIAFIGSPSIIYFDAITPGIDPMGRRKLYNIIGRVCRMGKSVLYATGDTKESELICQRLAILEDGAFRYLNTPNNFSQKYMRGYLLYVQVKPRDLPKSYASMVSAEGSKFDHKSLTTTASSFKSIVSPVSSKNLFSEASGSSIRSANPFLKLQAFVDEKFPNAVLKDQRGHMIFFFIPESDISMSEIYMEMERNAFNLNVANFTLTQHTLELVFCDLAEANAKRSSLI